ncbi:MAG: hypothetical protein ABIK28_18420 [Planctomycetota bacterium]
MSRFLKYSLIVALVLASFVSSSFILIWLLPNVFETQLYDVRAYWFGIAGGFLGGGIYMARGFYQSIMNKESPFDFERFGWWYFFRFPLGGVAGGLSIIVSKLAFDLQQTEQNLLAFFFVGILAGYNFTDFIKSKLSKKEM